MGKEGQNCEEGNFFSSSLSSIHENQQSDEKHNRKSSDTGTLLGTENFNSMANGKVFFCLQQCPIKKLCDYLINCIIN